MTHRRALLAGALEIVDRAPANPARNNRVKAEVLENLAKVYRAQGKVAQAEEAQARAAILWATQ